MDVSLVILIVAAVAVAFLVFGPLRHVREREARWGGVAEQLGGKLQGGEVRGEHEGLSVRMGMEWHAEGSQGLGHFCVVRAKVPGPLPPGFVAAPRRWTSGVNRLLASNLFASGDPALDEMYVFQSDVKAQGQAFLQDSEVKEALRGLLGAGGVAFVEKGQTGFASLGSLSDTEEIQRRFALVGRAALRLAASPASRALAEAPAQAG
ncbi:hypothetical protein [Stigmatella hybrida]|uniref:hypothetical protein n=1 Tax=Stigmatella hybrida TaxID=394097 RepID=UPI001CDB2EFA|nr:hypothetical protein [Stigmatella hybrida]